MPHPRILGIGKNYVSFYLTHSLPDRYTILLCCTQYLQRTLLYKIATLFYNEPSVCLEFVDEQPYNHSRTFCIILENVQIVYSL